MSFTYTTQRRCAKCHQTKPIKGGKKFGSGGRAGGAGVFVCADCASKQGGAKP